ncbi:unnamed protein product [Cylindrotheca closterium]|uniref:SET domain-containing protein n=1 Tax=Cylindrotheca closterium TaxID=2856 RepID=A0AAD2CSM0_9STRA|nr:unnamed protein product [Cylindrotheca closterium]
MGRFCKLLIAACLGHCIQDSLASKSNLHDRRKQVLEWLSEQQQEGFYFNGKLSLQDGRIIANRNVEADEVLMEIPRSAVLSVESDYEEGNTLCMLYNALVRELDLKGSSNYVVYLQQLKEEQASDINLPSLWSNTGQRLLELVSMTYPMNKITSVLEDYSHCIDGLQKEEKIKTDEVRDEFGIYNGEQHDNRAVEETPEEKTQKLNLALAVKHHIDRKLMVPLYDQLEHHHLNFNAKHQILKDKTVRIVAVRNIAAGEALFRPSMGCLEDCRDFAIANFIETFKNYGEVQNYPHLWTFGAGISLIYHGTYEGEKRSRPAAVGNIEWIEPPKYESQIALMAKEHSAQRIEYIEEVIPSRESVDEREWLQINKYCHGLMDVLNDIVVEGSKLDLISEEEEEYDSEDEDSEAEEDEEGDSDGDGEERDTADYLGAGISSEAREIASRLGNSKEDGYPWMVKGCDLSEDCTLDDIEDSRECGEEYEFDAYRNETEWVLMRSAYIAVVGPQKATLKLTYGSGIKVPFRVGHSPGRGRGVFATADIPKGTLVWQADFTATFTQGEQFRKFLSVLPDDMVCDLIMWCYTAVRTGGENVIDCDLDEGSLFNSYDELSEYNLGNQKVSFANSDLDSAFAMRDIQAGEEFITAYDEFDTEKYNSFGL